jgi:predicted nucleic acid-binding protein
MIVLDTTILLYAKGQDHPLRDPCRRLIEAIRTGRIRATTTPEVIQEFVHVRARRRSRAEAVALGHAYADLLGPLAVVDGPALRAGLGLFEGATRLGAFDSVLVAAAVAVEAEAVVTADGAFGEVRAVPVLVPGTAPFDDLLAG